VNPKKAISKSKSLTRLGPKPTVLDIQTPVVKIPESHLFSIEEIQSRAEAVTPLLKEILDSHPAIHPSDLF